MFSQMCRVFFSMMLILIPAGFVIAVAALAIIIEILMIALRFINIGFINLKIKIFLIIVSPAHRWYVHCQLLAL